MTTQRGHLEGERPICADARALCGRRELGPKLTLEDEPDLIRLRELPVRDRLGLQALGRLLPVISTPAPSAQDHASWRFDRTRCVSIATRYP